MGAENPLSTGLLLMGPAGLPLLGPARQYEESEKQKKIDEANQVAAKAGADKLLQQRQDQTKLEEASTTQAMLRTQQRTKPGAGRQSTILTSPIGYQGATVLGGGKSALGA